MTAGDRRRSRRANHSEQRGRTAARLVGGLALAPLLAAVVGPSVAILTAASYGTSDRERRREIADRVRHVVNLRGWPGIGHGWRPAERLRGYADRLGSRNGIVLLAAGDIDAAIDELALIGAVEIVGRSVIRRWLVVPDDLEDNGTKAYARLGEWAASQQLDTTTGPRPWQLISASAFFEPHAGVFARVAYNGAGFVIGADLGRVFGLVAEHIGARRCKYAESWEVWLPGWGKQRPDGRWQQVSPHRPPLALKARRVGWEVSFGWLGKGKNGQLLGKRVKGRSWRGAFLDVLSLAYALDADRSASFTEHCAYFDVAATELPVVVQHDKRGAEKIAETVETIRRLAIALDERAAELFTTPDERAEGRGRLDLCRTVSPGGIADDLLGWFGADSPFAKFDLTDEEHAAAAEGFHGGWCALYKKLCGAPFSALVLDLSSAFGLLGHLLGWWDVTIADRLVRVDVTAELVALCERAAEDPTVLLDPAVWRRFGICLVTVRPDFEIFPVEVADERRPDGRMEVVPLSSRDRPMSYPWPAVAAAAVLSKRVPEILKAVRFEPLGVQPRLRGRVSLLPGLVLDVDVDPVLALVRHRKLRGDPRSGGLLRAIVNSVVFGNPARFDDVRWMEGGDCHLGERPGPRCFLPLASSVSAGAELLLAVLDRMVADREGVVAYRDTDSGIIPYAPTGGVLTLPDRTVHQLSRADVGQVLEAFAALQVFGPEIPVWKQTGIDGGLQSVLFAEKAHVEFTLGPDGPVIVERTESKLGGFFADPPDMTGRAADTKRRFSLVAAEREVTYVVSRTKDPKRAVRPVALWDVGQALPFPAFRRLTVTSPELLDSLPRSLGARIGSHYIEAMTDRPFSGAGAEASVVALDPGGDLSKWPALRWLNRKTGFPVRVTTDPSERGAILVETLDHRAVEWSRPPRTDPIVEVVVDPVRIQHVGRVSGVIDAEVAGVPGDIGARRPLYGDPRTHWCELPGCDALIGRSNQRYCGPSHADRAYRKRRQRDKAERRDAGSTS